MQHPFRTRLVGVAAAAGLALAAAAAVPAGADDKPGPDGWVPLFNGKDLTGWKIHPEPNKRDITKVIEVKDGGKLIGYDAETKDGKRRYATSATQSHIAEIEKGTADDLPKSLDDVLETASPDAGQPSQAAK